ncbi:hypothetical protein QTP88_013285 [Uroleucon formosanum]
MSSKIDEWYNRVRSNTNITSKIFIDSPAFTDEELLEHNFHFNLHLLYCNYNTTSAPMAAEDHRRVFYRAATPSDLAYFITGMTLENIRLLHAKLSDLLKIFNLGYGKLLLGFFILILLVTGVVTIIQMQKNPVMLLLNENGMNFLNNMTKVK